MSKAKILIVDDDKLFRELYSDMLKPDGYEVKAVSSGEEALKYLEANKVDLVLTDLMMPGMDGQEVLDRTKQHDALIDVILITGHATIESAIAAMKKGAFDYIRKPVNQDEFLLTVSRCIKQRELVDENQSLKKNMKLFEVCRTITSCLDKDKLFDHVIDAVIQELPVDAGVFLSCRNNDKDCEMTMHLSKNLDRKVGLEVSSLFGMKFSKERSKLEMFTIHKVSDLADRKRDSLDAFSSYMVIPVNINENVSGYILAFCKGNRDCFSDSDLKNIKFLSEQAALSFENAEKYLAAQDMAYVDSLTDLYNSRFLDIVLDRETKRSSRTNDPFSVLFMDLDYFKSVNDVHGHLVGSKVLIEVGEILSNCVREVDSVVRYGGDEFTIILVETGYDVAAKVAERIRKTIEETSFVNSDGLDLKITASIGLAAYPIHAKNKKVLLEMADKAMYCGKDRSRNTVYVAPLPEARH